MRTKSIVLSLALLGTFTAATPAHAGLTPHRIIVKTRAAIANGLGKAVGYLEMAGLKYKVTPYDKKISNSLWRGSRLNDKQIKSLKRRGFSTIIALTAESHSDAKTAAEVGLNYVNIPIIDNTAPTFAQVQEFLKTVQDSAKNGPVYVHCEQGVGRTGIMVAAYRMAVDGWSAPQALAEAEKPARGFKEGGERGLRLPVQREFIRKLWTAINSGEISIDRNALQKATLD